MNADFSPLTEQKGWTKILYLWQVIPYLSLFIKLNFKEKGFGFGSLTYIKVRLRTI